MHYTGVTCRMLGILLAAECLAGCCGDAPHKRVSHIIHLILLRSIYYHGDFGPSFQFACSNIVFSFPYTVFGHTTFEFIEISWMSASCDRV